MLRMARHVHRETGMENLCLAGGVALNCVGNGRLLREGPFERLWIQPAAGDAGGALGVALRDLAQGARQRRARARPGARRHARARISGRRSPTTRSRRSCATPARSTRRCRPTTLIARTRARLLAAGEGRRLVPGPHGVRAARARRPQHPRRSALAEDAVDHEPEDQVPRELPAVRAERAARARRASTSSSTATRPTCCWWRRCSATRRIPMTDGAANACSASRSSTCRARTSRRSPTSTTRRASRPCTRETNPLYHALLDALPRPHRLPGAGQHQLQRPRRADRLHARGRLPLLHAHRDGLPGARARSSSTRRGSRRSQDDVDWRTQYQLD